MSSEVAHILDVPVDGRVDSVIVSRSEVDDAILQVRHASIALGVHGVAVDHLSGIVSQERFHVVIDALDLLAPDIHAITIDKHSTVDGAHEFSIGDRTMVH